jgi:hypothetical protein
MTRKHFVMIAEIVREILDDGERYVTAHAFALRLGAESPRFDRERFLTACGV